MNRTQFRAKLQPTNKQLSFDTGGITTVVKDGFKLHTLLLGGSILQLILCTALPLRWAAVPPAVVLLNAIISTILQLRKPSATGFTARVVPGRATAQLPLQDGSPSSSPAERPIVVLNLGVQFNHPLGALSPGGARIRTSFDALNDQLERRRDEFGLLGSSSWRGDDRESHNTFLSTYYFRDVEGLHKFAHDPMHRSVWDWYSSSSQHRHIGVLHETFCVPRGAYETIYVNCHPALAGRMAVRRETAAGDQWVNSLVSADTPALKTQYARLARDEQGNPKYDAVGF